MKRLCFAGVALAIATSLGASTAQAQERSCCCTVHRGLSRVGQRVDGSLRTVGGASEEAVYVTGDAVELGYRLHPGARLGRRFGVLPPGKLGLLPSHDRPVRRLRF